MIVHWEPNCFQFCMLMTHLYATNQMTLISFTIKQTWSSQKLNHGFLQIS
jgi:hypothetical protein